MKYLRCLTILIVLLGVSSCNQGKIENLETQVLELEKENKLLKSHIEELEEIIEPHKEDKQHIKTVSNNNGTGINRMRSSI